MTLNDKVQTGDTVTGTSTGKTTTSQWQTYKADQGWECPRCGRINAPWVRQCDCSRNNWSITCDDTTAGDEWWKTKITCDDTTASDEWWKKSADTFRIHPEEMAIYTTAHNSTVGGSDYWDEVNKIWTNIPDVSNNVTTKEDIPWYKYFTLTSDKINELQTQINNLKETK